ncbi:MAG: 5-deoxy-glucuronate isomerase [Clostridiales bacterium]|nr:5-deoxy-glucuronate isomerase [Clostridiales bacterium]
MDKGYNVVAGKDTRADMLMDAGVYVFETSQTAEFFDEEQESAFLLLSGEVEITWDSGSERARRTSLFDQGPTCLHVPRASKVTIRSVENGEVLIQRTDNPRQFPAKFYTPGDTADQVLGGGLMQNTARRLLRDIFNYGGAPYSNMVMGEVITFPGRWSSFPPHHHPQPEIYFYRFDKPQGFGVSVIGGDAFVVRHNGMSAIPGGLCHPQVSAPGYAMYYCWMIRHLDGNPWLSRIDDPQHTWLLDPEANIWGY